MKSKSLQARGISPHDLGDLGPGPRLPDAKTLCRNAGRLLNCAAFRSSNLGNVSNDPPTAMSASTQKTARWFASAYGDLRPSGSSHASSACFSSQCKGSKVLQSPVWQTQTRLIGYLMRFTTGIRCELAIGDGRRMSRRNHRMSEMGHCGSRFTCTGLDLYGVASR